MNEDKLNTDTEDTTENEEGFDVESGTYAISSMAASFGDKKRKERAKNRKVIGSKEEFNPDTGVFERSIEKKLTTKDRKKMDTKEFGIPELKKYPLNDVAHVKSAISYFNKAPAKYKHSLALKILRAAKKYGVKVSKDSDVYKEAYKSSKSKESLDFSCESFINNIII